MMEMRLNGPARWLEPPNCPPMVLSGLSIANGCVMMEDRTTELGRLEQSGKATVWAAVWDFLSRGRCDLPGR